jgi:AcrR family transcriptional regulator
LTEPKNQAPPRDRSRRRRRNETGADGASGRNQIIEATIASILEVGFYRSSTNEIARRANVSWGAVQYHFGTREALMVAVVEALDERFTADILSAKVEGDTPEARIESLYDILRQEYETPAVFVRLQIVLNLQHDPDTSSDVNKEIADQAARSQDAIRRLLREAIGEDATKAASEALFHALRGFALSIQLSRTVPARSSKRQTDEATRLFLRALASASDTLTEG